MSKQAQGRWLGSSVVMAAMIAIFVAAGGLGAPGCSGGGENPISVSGGGDIQLRGTPGGSGGDAQDADADPGRAKVLGVDLPECVDSGLRGTIHLDRDWTGELAFELLYRSNADARTGSDETLVDTARRATARFQGSSSSSFEFGQFSAPGDAQCFVVELERTNGAAWINSGSWQRGSRERACIPVCAQTTTTTTTGSTTVTTSTVPATTTSSTTSTATVPTTTSTQTTTTSTTAPITTTTATSTTIATTTVPTITTTSTTTAPTITVSCAAAFTYGCAFPDFCATCDEITGALGEAEMSSLGTSCALVGGQLAVGVCPSWASDLPGHCSYVAPATTTLLTVPFAASIDEHHDLDWAPSDAEQACRSSGGVWVP